MEVWLSDERDREDEAECVRSNGATSGKSKVSGVRRRPSSVPCVEQFRWLIRGRREERVEYKG